MKLCFWIPEIEMKSEGQSKGAREGHEHVPRSSRSPSMVTRSVAERRSSESIKQQRSMSNHHSGRQERLGANWQGGVREVWCSPELRRLKPLAVLPKE